MNRLYAGVAALVLLAATAFGQGTNSNSILGGNIASNYNYSIPLSVAVASTDTTLSFQPSACANMRAGSKSVFMLNINAPITIQGANSETITPSAVSYDGSRCTATVSLSNAHGAGVAVTSGTGGLQEAINDLPQAGGTVFVTPDSSVTTANITAAVGSPFVNIKDLRGAADVLYAWRPNTLTALATPATRSATAGNTQVIDGTAVGTFANAPLFVCVTYVDALGGESPCSASFSYTPAGSLATNWASPAASTGAVGWRAYAGITGTSTQYQLPITSANCVLSTQETLYPACAIGAAAVFTTPLTTSSLAPGYVVNTYRPNTQSHTTFAYAPVSQPAQPGFQQHYGPFIASAGGTTGQIEVLGTVPLPSAFLNNIGHSIRVHGHITMTAGTSETPVLKVQLGPSFTTGTPTNICQFANTTALSAAVYSLNFTCTLTTNATGASGTVMPDGMAVVALGAGTTAGTSMPELATAAITNKLDALNGNGNLLYVTYIPTSGTNTAAQLIDLHLENIN